MRSTAAPYTESRLAHLVRNKCVGFPVVEQSLWLNLRDVVVRENVFRDIVILKKIENFINILAKKYRDNIGMDSFG